MNISQITETLQTFFETSRVVFWNDAENEFSENLEELIPGGVTLLKLDEIGALKAKIRIEIEEPERKFLVYSPTAQPAPEDDWMLDVRLYAKNFTADSASLLLNELGLESQILREFLAGKKQFFASRDRLQKLKKLVSPSDDENALNKKMLAVAVRADQPETFTILLKIISELSTQAEKSGADLREVVPDVWKDIEKFDLAEYFWNLAAETFGYSSNEPRLYDLLVRLFVTDFAVHARRELPESIRPLVMENSTNAAVFSANWRTNSVYKNDFRNYSHHIEREIKADDWMKKVSAEVLSECETFEAVEKRIIADLRDRLLAPLPSNAADWQNLMSARRNRFWCQDEGASFAAVYDALDAAIEFLRLRDKYGDTFNFPNAAAVFAAYTGELFQFDQNYRRFSEASQEIKFKGWNILKDLNEKIEKLYGNWFLENLGTIWGKCLEHENKFDNWQIEGVRHQPKFFRQYVKPLAAESAERKIYVIISDAFRYECAEELTRILNTESRKSGKALLEAELSSMLGVVPSYTALGMASLLPHDAYGYKAENPKPDTLYADGRSTAGTDNRAAVLSKVKGTAVKFEDFINKGKDGGRDFVRDLQIIYIYHNVIDAVGDSQNTESETFKAVRQTLSELGQLVGYIFNSLNGSQILITADHGFLYQENAPEQLDKSTLDIKSGEALKRKKRYVIDPVISEQANAWRGNIRVTAGIEGDMQFLIPKGTGRFHFTGGARFVHGGAMPQEICIPLITIKKLRGKEAEKTRVEHVGVTILGNITRIVNNVQRFEFIQTEKVSERNLPRTLQISLRRAPKGELVSNEAIVTFDSTSDAMDDRKKSVQLTLRTGQYDRTDQFYLVLNDNDSIVKEYLKIPMTIDIAFSSDF